MITGDLMHHPIQLIDPQRPGNFDMDKEVGGRTRQEWFNPAAFTNPADGLFGNVGRNTISGPGNISIDFSIFKNFQIRERLRLQFRTEFFNLINHPNFRSPSTTYDSSNPGELTAAGTSRQIQFALKLLF